MKEKSELGQALKKEKKEIKEFHHDSIGPSYSPSAVGPIGNDVFILKMIAH
jgi:hypothetical protein